MDALSIAGDLLDDIRLDSETRKPNEACGILIGTINHNKARVAEVIPMVNMLDSSTKFIISPTDLYQVWKAMDSKGKEVIGAYHSHPNGDAIPSKDDVEGMINTTFIWMIVGKDGSTRAYAYEGALKELTINIK